MSTKFLVLSLGLLAAGTFGAAQSGPAVRGGQEPPARRGAAGRRLLPQVDTLRLWYIVWGCHCPPWATPADMQRYNDNPDKLARHTIFIEPATPALELPEHYHADINRYYVRVAGQFYARRGYPQGGEREMPPARVLRYTWYELEEVNSFLPKDDTTLVVSYDALSCPCAKWATRPNEEEPYQRKHIYLEPATAQLPDADKLWLKTGPPLRVRVTGQFVSEAGLPKGYAFGKGDPEKAPVFRYRRLQVLPHGPKPPRRPKR